MSLADAAPRNAHLVRATKKPDPPQKLELDAALKAISANPAIGDAKVGDLAGVRVYKFRLASQICLLAYRILDEEGLKLLSVYRKTQNRLAVFLTSR